MQINTTARHCELDGELRGFVQQRLEKFVRFASDIHDVHLILTAEKFRHTAEITLRLNQHELVSRDQATEARVAIDLAADRIEEQLRRHKDRRIERVQRARGADGPAPEPAAESDEALEEE
jgi:putative sigma-54 modulation protein